MISEHNQKILRDLNLRLERVVVSSLSGEVIVGVSDAAGNRFLGRVGRNGDIPASLQAAFEVALNQYDPTWKHLKG